jgi:E3 ubiquitin-protein ligase RFWD3
MQFSAKENTPPNEMNGEAPEDDFQSPITKKQRFSFPVDKETEVPSPGNQALEDEAEEDEDEDDNEVSALKMRSSFSLLQDAEGCPICLEQWTTSGSHRLCSLKCGHLFGKRCIERWLSIPKNGEGVAKSKCPQCNEPAKRADIRVLYTKRRLAAADNSEREALMRQLEAERLQRKLAVEAEATTMIALRASMAQLEEAKKELDRLRRHFAALPGSVSLKPTFLAQPRRFTLCKLQGQTCRSVDFDPYFATVLATKTLTPQQHGIVKVSLLDKGNQEFIPIHSQALRALSHSPFKDGLVLTTGNDSKLCLTTLHSNTILQAYTLESSGWSCAFHPSDRNLVLAGLANGRVSIFDLRNTNGPLNTFRVDFGNALRNLPIHTIIPLEKTILGASMDGLFMTGLESPGEKFWSWNAPLKGSCTSASFDADKVLLSYRMMPPSLPGEHFRLGNVSGIIDLFNSDQEIAVDPFRFSAQSGQTILTRSIMFSYESSGQMAVIPDEATSSLHIYDLFNDSTILQASLSTSTHKSPILDVFHSDTKEFGRIIGGLNERELVLFTEANRLSFAF